MWLIEDDVPGSVIGYRAIVDEDGTTICAPSPMGEANARLIASAPDLRAALEGLLDQVEQMRGLFNDSDGAIARALKDAKLALEASYAKGE